MITATLAQTHYEPLHNVSALEHRQPFAFCSTKLHLISRTSSRFGTCPVSTSTTFGDAFKSVEHQSPDYQSVETALTG